MGHRLLQSGNISQGKKVKSSWPGTWSVRVWGSPSWWTSECWAPGTRVQTGSAALFAGSDLFHHEDQRSWKENVYFLENHFKWLCHQILPVHPGFKLLQASVWREECILVLLRLALKKIKRFEGSRIVLDVQKCRHLSRCPDNCRTSEYRTGDPQYWRRISLQPLRLQTIK